MASIEEVRSGIALATQKASESLGALQQAQSHLEEAQASLARVTEGTAQSDAQNANAQLQHAAQSVNEVQQLVHSAISSAEGVSQRL
ncbi:MAG TPA: hypothetical protein VGH99_03040 [Pseudonocardia sp.]|jgi:hypothetical protein